MKKLNMKKVLAENLSALMKNEGLTEKALESKSGVSAATIGNIRRRDTNASAEIIQRLARPFNMPAFALLIEGLDPDLGGPQLNELVNCYQQASSQGRSAIRRYCAAEAHLSA